MADTKISAEVAATDLSGAEFAGIQGGSNKRFSSSLFAADAAAQEAASSNIVFVTPGVQHRHPSAPKAWVNFNGTGTPAITRGYGASSITDSGTGDWTVNWSVTMSGTGYCVVASGDASASGNRVVDLAGSVGTASVRLTSEDKAGAFGSSRSDTTTVTALLLGDI